MFRICRCQGSRLKESTARIFLVLSCIGIAISGFEWMMSEQYPYGDDNSAHFAVGVHIANIFVNGEFNFWWHQSNLGVPLFAAYQPLPSLFLGLLLTLFSGVVHPTIVQPMPPAILTIYQYLSSCVRRSGVSSYGINTLAPFNSSLRST